MSKAEILTGRWWKYAGIRAGRTALGLMIPFLAPFIQDGNAVPALMAAGFGAITSLASSLRGLREVNGENVPKWQAILTRAAWSLGQGIVTGFGTAALLTEVDWNAVWQAAASGVLMAIVLGLISALPETPEVVTEFPTGGVPPQEVADAPSVEVVPEGATVYSEDADGSQAEHAEGWPNS